MGWIGSLLAGAFSWLFKSVISVAVVKFLTTVSLFFGIQYAITSLFVVGFLPDYLSLSYLGTKWASFISSASVMSGSVGSFLLYTLNYFMVPFALATAMNAQVTRFMIRRMFK